MEQELFDIPKIDKPKNKVKGKISDFTKFKHNLYEKYKINMKQFGKEDEIVSYRKWLKNVNNAKIK